MYGTNSVDYPIKVCYKDWKNDKSISKYMEFGGMYSSIYEHPFTGKKECPTDWKKHKILGTSNFDNEINYCFKVHNEKPKKI